MAHGKSKRTKSAKDSCLEPQPTADGSVGKGQFRKKRSREQELQEVVDKLQAERDAAVAERDVAVAEACVLRSQILQLEAEKQAAIEMGEAVLFENQDLQAQLEGVQESLYADNTTLAHAVDEPEQVDQHEQQDHQSHSQLSGMEDESLED